MCMGRGGMGNSITNERPVPLPDILPQAVRAGWSRGHAYRSSLARSSSWFGRQKRCSHIVAGPPPVPPVAVEVPSFLATYFERSCVQQCGAWPGSNTISSLLDHSAQLLRRPMYDKTCLLLVQGGPGGGGDECWIR